MPNYLIPNIQLFAEPVDPAPAEPVNQSSTPTGKTFSEEYVSALRGESANYRTKAKTYEAVLRKALGLKDGEELGDLDGRLTTYQQVQQKQLNDALTVANQRLIGAELKAMEGYDHKLLSKVIDLSKVTVDDKGEVTGLKEAVEAAVKEFPAVKAAQRPQYVPQNPAAGAQPGQGEVNKEAFTKMGYLDRLKLKQEHPEIYEKLKE